jgi:hypothetical protein
VKLVVARVRDRILNGTFCTHVVPQTNSFQEPFMDSLAVRTSDDDDARSVMSSNLAQCSY